MPKMKGADVDPFEKMDLALVEFIEKTMASKKLEDKKWAAEFWAKYRWKGKKEDSPEPDRIHDDALREENTRLWLLTLAKQAGTLPARHNKPGK